MEMENEREKSVKQIEHPFHEQHPLVFVEEQMNESGDEAWCYGCWEAISGPYFSCVQCNYHLHKECAEAPYSIHNHPLHPKHSGLSLREWPNSDSNLVHGCALCKEKRNVFFYECNDCGFSLDIKCANLSSSLEFNHVSKHTLHQHPLTSFETPMDEHKKLHCTLCHEPLFDDHMYLCFECPLFFHKKCLDGGSNKVKHPSHRVHPLFLESNENILFCTPCQKEHDGFFCRCSLCNFNISIACACPVASVAEHKSCHRHPFTKLWRPDSFTCDACDTEGNCLSYICSTCDVMVHKHCTQLPRIVKFSRHDHCIFHKYFLDEQELTRKDCKICFNEVKVERGSYSCVKPRCNYAVHVNCALKHKYLYDVVEDENQCEELYENLAKSLQSSIIRVLEVNNDGEATVIEHFSHQHCLALSDKIIDRKCDGCMLSISSTTFYYCPECPFFLHKTCAELPRNKPHWFLLGNVTLESKDIFKCFLCDRLCSGFFYKIGAYILCLRCAKVPDIIEECQGHQHLLFIDYNCREQCNACGVSGTLNNGAFRCSKCAFTLDFACLTLPHSTRHKFDEHELKLTYRDGDKEQCICDICEKERDPSFWYYHCSICDNSAHTECVLGEFSFLKDGSIMLQYNDCEHPHVHDLEFFRKADGYPECSVCGRLCIEEILKCADSTCKFIIHIKCRHKAEGLLIRCYL